MRTIMIVFVAALFAAPAFAAQTQATVAPAQIPVIQQAHEAPVAQVEGKKKAKKHHAKHHAPAPAASAAPAPAKK